MNFLLILIGLLTSVLAKGASSQVMSIDSPSHEPNKHANHIFNALHSSMRQFGSSLNHNGMGFYIASVPRGVELYHGTDYPYRVNGTEWLAFEAEHALYFASKRLIGEPPGRQQPQRGSTTASRHDRPQSPFNLAVDPQDLGRTTSGHGYLHTYKTNRSLRLMYVDGQSAAKSDFGTLETQDLVIRGLPATDPRVSAEYDRAKDLCRIAKDDWQSRIDGILRMEGGFEIILCSFKDFLDLADVKEISAPVTLDTFGYHEAVASRYDGIGGGRVSLHYDSFVSMFMLENATYFDEEGRPRVRRESSQIKRAQEMIREMALRPDIPISDSINWQEITDMTVSRWSDRLEYLFTLSEDEQQFKEQLSMMLRPFIDQAHRDPEREIGRCVRQYWPEASRTSGLATQAVRGVVSSMCRNLWAAYKEAEAGRFEEATKITLKLKTYLSWTTWRKCRNCQIHEICRLPIWPMGSKEDFIRPRCTSDFQSSPRGDYWNWNGAHRPPH